MRNIIVVEDKKITRDGITKLIDWASIGGFVSAAFSSGNEAIEYLQHHAVDVIISDIEMENGTGIDLLRFVHEHRPQIKVIIISAYERFSYAHDALSLGAFSYVLKPLDEAVLLEKTAQAFAELAQAQKSIVQKSFLVWERAAAHILPFLESGISDELENALQALGESFSVAASTCFLFQSYSKHLSLHRLREIAAEIGQPVLLFAYEETFCGILSGALPAAPEVFDVLRTQWQLDSIVRFGVSEPVRTMQDWPHAISLARTALAYGFWNVGREIVWEKSLPQSARTDAALRLDTATLGKLLFADDEPAAAQLFSQTFDRWKSSCAPVSHAVAQSAGALLQLYSAHFSPDDNPDFFENRQALFESKSDGHALSLAVQNELHMLFSRVRAQQTQAVRPIVKLAFEYAVQHIDKVGLNLKTIAKELKVSYVYLSKAFKEDFKVGYTEYMNLYRLELAQKYLKDPQYKIYEICALIGLEQKNFYYLFKKATGITPKEYQVRIVHYSEEE